MLKKYLKYFVKNIRKENLEIGNFSNIDITRIFISRFFNFLHGVCFFLIRFKKPKFLFLGSNVKIIGLEKIKFSNTTTIHSNVKISSIGSLGLSFGSNFSIRSYSIIDSFGSIKKESGILKIGNNVGISEFCYFSIRGNIFIGDNVIFGPGVKIFTENHSFKINNEYFRLQDEIRNDVIIGNNVWVGSNVVLLPGIIIEDNVVIAAGSVVNKNVPKGTLYAGNPANFLKNLN
jgi:acetyltransferase-like isoleucine patch superfamily enzyme